jgi:hypothetical protein
MPVIQAYAWAATRRPITGIAGASWASSTDTRGDADFIAGRVATQLLRYPLEQRAVLIYTPLGYSLDQHVTKHTVKPFLTQQVDTSKARNWYLEFFAGLKKRGAELTAIVMDEESNVTNWGFENYGKNDKTLPAYLHQVWADAEVQMAMPDELRRFTIEMILQKDRDAVVAYNQWSMTILCEMIRKTMVVPYTQVFGKVPIVSNWENFHGAFQTLDHNGWPNSTVQVTDWSSPCCYVGMFGNRQNQAMSGRKKDVYWNRFLDCINYVRSAMAFNGKCAPWISYRSWVDPFKIAPNRVQWLWNQLMLHIASTGVEKLIYWNPKQARGATDEDDAALGEFIAAVAKWPKVQIPNLPEIPMDADEVATGAITTRYADYDSGKEMNLGF